MGKAKILSGSDGVYDITYYYDVHHATAELAKLDADIAAADIQIATLIDMRDAQQTKVTDLIVALNIKIGAFQICASSVPPCASYDEQLATINKDIDALEQEKLLLYGFTESVERLKGDKLSDEKRRGFLTSLTPPTASMTVYSVDNPEDDNGDLISTTVGTVDPMANVGSQVSSLDMPRVHTILRPLYSGSTYNKARDKAATPIAGMGVAQSLSVAVQFPYAIKYNPRWMTAIITAVDNAAELVDIDVYGNTPSDPKPTALTGAPLYSIPSVPVVYMECGVFAFKVDDYVIVEFGGVGRVQPVVIGFVRNPRKCPRFNGWKIANGKYVHSSYDPSNGWTWLANSGVGGNLSWTGWGKGGGGVKTVSWWGRKGKHYGGRSSTTAAQARNAYMDGQTYTFPYAVFGCCARRETVGAAKHWFIYAVCRPQAGETPGTFEAGSGYDEYLYKMRADLVGGAVLVWSGGELATTDGSDPVVGDQSPEFAYKNTAAVFFNQSATEGVCIWNGRLFGEFTYPAYIVRYNLTDSTRPVSNATSPAFAFFDSFSTVLAIEYDNDREIRLNYQQTYTHNLATGGPDIWNNTAWSLDIDGNVLESGNIYNGSHFGTLTESSGSLMVILGANLVAGGVVLAIRDHTATAPNAYHQTYRLKVMGETLYTYAAPVRVNNTFPGRTFAAEPGGSFSDYTYQMTNSMQMAHGPDGKYVFYAGAFVDITQEPNPVANPIEWSHYVGRFTNEPPYLFKSNDIDRVTFETQSSASQPYPGQLGVI